MNNHHVGQSRRARLRSLAQANLIIAVVFIAIMAVAGCALTGSSSSAAGTQSTGATSRQPAGSIVEFPAPNDPNRITAGPDGNLWFTEYDLEVGTSQIGRITPTGQITKFPLSTGNTQAHEITAGPDGNLWFTEYFGGKIGRITPTGQFTEFPPNTFLSHPFGITAGPDGNLWFTESSKIGRITP